MAIREPSMAAWHRPSAHVPSVHVFPSLVLVDRARPDRERGGRALACSRDRCTLDLACKNQVETFRGVRVPPLPLTGYTPASGTSVVLNPSEPSSNYSYVGYKSCGELVVDKATKTLCLQVSYSVLPPLRSGKLWYVMADSDDHAAKSMEN